MFLDVVCFIGACAGSTTSGIKVVHYVLIGKYMYSAIKKMYIQPMSVISICLNGKPVDLVIVDLAICYFIINSLLLFTGSYFMAFIDNLDYTTAMIVIIATLMNTGPDLEKLDLQKTTPSFQMQESSFSLGIWL